MITLVLHSVVGPGILLSLLVLHPRAALAQTAPLESAALPANIRVSPLLESTVSALLRKSKTFAQQCARIGEARFTRLLLVATPPPRDLLTPRARSYITRHVYGGLRAIVQVPLTGEQAELIAHEFEHVIEQIEGLDLVPSRGREGTRSSRSKRASTRPCVPGRPASPLPPRRTAKPWRPSA